MFANIITLAVSNIAAKQSLYNDVILQFLAAQKVLTFGYER